MANKSLQPTATPSLRCGSASAEFGRWAFFNALETKMNEVKSVALFLFVGLIAGCSGGDGGGYCVGSFEGGVTDFGCTTCNGPDGTKDNEFAAAIDNHSNTARDFGFGNTGGNINITVTAPVGQSFPAGSNAGALIQFPAGVPLSASYSLFNDSAPVAATSGSTIATGTPPPGAGSATFYPVVPSATINRIELVISVPASASGAAFHLNEVCGAR